MGVEGLYKFINLNCPEIYFNISIKDIRKRSCIIDGMQHIYTQLIYMRSKNKEIYSEKGKNISHIHGLINSLTYYLRNKLIPIFIFDGKSPEIKRKKIEERKIILKNNLNKLKELETVKKDIDILLNELVDKNQNEENVNLDKYIFGTPPELLNMEEELKKASNLQEEYNKIYKKSIVLKDYYITDWIEILTLLGLPVIKADGEADPLCAYILKNNKNIYGIISDDSDMLIFGAPRLMRKAINQQFKIIELDRLIDTISIKLRSELGNNVTFTNDDLLNFSILLGTDYGTFDIKLDYENSYDLLKYYYESEKEIVNIIGENEIERFNEIKNYYKNYNFDGKIKNNILNSKPEWEKPKLMDLKKRLLELDVDEDYIDKTNEFFEEYYNKYNNKNYYKIKIYDNKYDKYFNHCCEAGESINEYNSNKSSFFFNKSYKKCNQRKINHIDNVDLNDIKECNEDFSDTESDNEITEYDKKENHIDVREKSNPISIINKKK